MAKVEAKCIDPTGTMTKGKVYRGEFIKWKPTPQYWEDGEYSKTNKKEATHFKFLNDKFHSIITKIDRFKF